MGRVQGETVVRIVSIYVRGKIPYGVIARQYFKPSYSKIFLAIVRKNLKIECWINRLYVYFRSQLRPLHGRLFIFCLRPTGNV